ncbi:MAG TPA: hypothetical protein VGI06_13405, partial [Acidimicrobiales bacterium]
SESTAKADAVALRGGAPVAAASARAMAVLDYLSMCGESAPLLSGTYRSVWVVTVRVTAGPYTAVIDADHNKVVGACEGTRCSNIPPGS